MDALQFEPVAHRYTVGDRELISVTQVLTEAGFIDSRWFTESAAVRGTAVHAAVQAFNGSGVVPTDDVVAPFFDAYLAFQLEAGYVVEMSEERVFNPLLGYAGTLDLRGRFVKYPTGIDLIDIKTGMVPSWVGYQTAAYARLLPDRIIRRWALQLRADGTYRLQPLTGPADERVFLAALTVAQAKRGWL